MRPRHGEWCPPGTRSPLRCTDDLSRNRRSATSPETWDRSPFRLQWTGTCHRARSWTTCGPRKRTRTMPETDDDWALYADHRAHFTEAIVASASRAGGRLCVLGAGKCNDVDLERLA